MSTASGPVLRVFVAPDRSRADLLIPPGLPDERLSVEACRAALEEMGVKWTTAVEQTVVALVADRPRPDSEPLRLTVAASKPPEHGVDGRVEWAAQAAAGLEALDDGARRDFYAARRFVGVRAGEVLGTVIEPTPGVAGRDVTGRALPARPGKPAVLRLDETVRRDRDGRLIAEVDGLLVRTDTTARISRVLEVDGNVDFSTGHIEFDGDVVVRGGVCDLFRVSARGSVEISGLIEAATIECDGDLIAPGGIAGRNRARLRIDGALWARYVDGGAGEIGGDLRVEKEIINSDLRVRGVLQSPQATVIGGRLGLSGVGDIGTLGSDAGVPTLIELGSQVDLESSIVNCQTARNRLVAHRDALAAERAALPMADPSASADVRARLARLAMEMETASLQLARVEETLARLIESRQHAPRVDLRVRGWLRSGVTIASAGMAYRLVKDLRGPLRIVAARDGGLRCRIGDEAPSSLARWSTTALHERRSA